MHALTRLLAAGVCAACAASAVHAQIGSRAGTSPSASARAATAAPQPSGLRPIFPAGVTSGSGAAVSRDPIAASTSPVPAGTSTAATSPTAPGGGRVPSELLPADTNIGAITAPNTAVLGAGATAPGPAQGGGGGAGGFAAVDTARSFFFADGNHDGELTRAEARRLSIATMSFEEMDRNFDGVISRFEYDDSVR